MSFYATVEIMISKEIKEKYSCRRKSDFVTYFAICFFILVVIFELYLIVWMPIQLRREGVLEKHVAKENLVTLADSIRDQLNGVRGKDALTQGEIDLAKKVMDLYALYIREHQDALTLPQILDLYKMLNRYQTALEHWKTGKFAFQKEIIDLPAAFQVIEKKHHL